MQEDDAFDAEKIQPYNCKQYPNSTNLGKVFASYDIK